MPYIVVNMTYPRDKSEEAAKAYLEMINKFPDDPSLGTAVVPSATMLTLEGIKVVAITEIKPGKLENALIRTTSQMLMFRSIQGFNYETRIALTIQEALGTLGMKLPG